MKETACTVKYLQSQTSFRINHSMYANIKFHTLYGVGSTKQEQQP